MRESYESTDSEDQAVRSLLSCSIAKRYCLTKCETTKEIERDVPITPWNHPLKSYNWHQSGTGRIK